MAKAITGGNFDLVVTLSTPCLQVMAGANRQGRLRQVFGIVTDPFVAGVGLARGQTPEARPTGLCGAGTFQPVRELFRLVHQLRPDLKTVGVVWCPGETCSRACLDLARDECAQLGITLEEATVDNSNGVYEAGPGVGRPRGAGTVDRGRQYCRAGRGVRDQGGGPRPHSGVHQCPRSMPPRAPFLTLAPIIMRSAGRRGG